MLDGLLGKKNNSFAAITRKTSLEWGLDNIVEKEGSVDEQSKAGHLEPFESFPAQG